MLEVRDLTAIRDDRELFESVTFSVCAGDLVQVEGRNGSGKTTMLRIITGLGSAILDRSFGMVLKPVKIETLFIKIYYLLAIKRV